MAGGLEERRLVNICEAIALAAGVQPPRVRILDDEAPLAAATAEARFSDRFEAEDRLSRALVPLMAVAEL